MSVVRELVTKLSFAYENSGLKKFVNEVKQAKTKANADVGQIRTNLLSLKGAVVGYVAALAGGSVMQIADEWASVSGRVKLATQSAEEHKHAMEEIYNIAQRTGQTFAASGDLFQKVQRNAADLGLNTDDTLKMTEIIGQTLTIGGGDASSQQAALMQLGQALGTGKLRGDELTSIMEQSPRLAEAIADSFGVGVGQLKEMGEAGKLTAKALSQGLLKQADKIQKEFDQMPKTFSSGLTTMKNAMGRWISYAVNDVLKLGQKFYKLSQWLEKNIKLVLILATSAIGGKLMLALRGVQGSLTLIAKNAWKAAAPFLAMTAALAVVGLILEDLYVWVNGGQSLAGDLFGDFKLWQGQFIQIGDSLKLLWFNVKNLLKEFGALVAIDFDFDWESWGDFAKSVLQYVIDGVKNFIELFQSTVRIVRSLLRGDFKGAFDHAGDAVGGLEARFLPFYSLALMVFGGIGSAVFWLVSSPFRLFGKACYSIGWALAKSAKTVWFFAKPFWGIAKTLFSISKFALPYFLKSIVKIFSIARAAIPLVFSMLRGVAMAFLSPLWLLAKGIGWFVKFAVQGIWFISKAIGGLVLTAVKGIFTVARAMFMAMAANPILLAIALVIAAIVAIIVYWDEIKAIAGRVWDWISTKAIAIWEGIKTACSEMWEAISTKATEIWEGIKTTLMTMWDEISQKATEVWEDIKTTCATIWEEAKDNALKVWDGIADLIKKIWSGIMDFFSNGWGNAIKSVTEAFSSLIPNWVKNLFSKGSSVTVNGTAENPHVSTVSAQQAGNRNLQVTQNQNVVVNAKSNDPAGIARETATAISKMGTSGYQMSQVEYAGGAFG